MSESELNEPPRIGLRIWHWFVWIPATLLMIKMMSRAQVRPVDLSDLWNLASVVIWSAHMGFVLTASIAAWNIARQQSQPDEVRWSPGHFLLGMLLVTTLMVVALILLPGIGSSIFMIWALGLFSSIVVIGTVAFSQARTRAWRLFFGGWIAALFLKRDLSFTGIRMSDTLDTMSISVDVICVGLLTFAAASDVARRPRPLYYRTWTHWGGVFAMFVSIAATLGWGLVDSQSS